jgi:hypothetical protein
VTCTPSEKDGLKQLPTAGMSTEPRKWALMPSLLRIYITEMEAEKILT